MLKRGGWEKCRRKGHTEEQIIAALKQQEAGEKTTEICRKLGISQATFYLWKRQYAGLGVQELHELRQLREENSRLKRIVADLTLDRQILQEVVSKKLGKASPAAPIGEVGAGGVSGFSERRAARILAMAWSTMRYRSRRPLQEALRGRLRQLAATHVRYGYRRLTVLLRREGWAVNAKRIYRLYDEEQLKVRSVERKKIGRRQRVAQPPATAPNQAWAADFVSDKLTDGRAYRILTVIDQFTRECIAR